MKSRPRLAGFTLVELLVVIAIIGLLIAILLPAVQAAREAARRTQCGNNIKQISLAVQNYESIHGAMPSSRFGAPYTQDIGWLTAILPHLEQSVLYDQYQVRTWAFASENQAIVNTELPFLICPSSPGVGVVNDVNEFFGFG